MGRISLIYSFVARDTVILADYTRITGKNFATDAAQYLGRLPRQNKNMICYYSDDHSFNYLVQDNYIYCVVADKSAGAEFPRAFLKLVKLDFQKYYDKAKDAGALSLNNKFRHILKMHMIFCVNDPECVSEFMKRRAQASFEIERMFAKPVEVVVALLLAPWNWRAKSQNRRVYCAMHDENGVENYAVIE